MKPFLKISVFVLAVLFSFGTQAQSAMQANFRSSDGYFTATIPGGWENDFIPLEGYRLSRMKNPIGTLMIKSYKRFDDSARAIQFIVDKTDGHGGVKKSVVGDKEYTRYNFSVQMEGKESNTSVTIVRQGHRILAFYYSAPRIVNEIRYWQAEINEVNTIIASVDFPQ